jgi:seryl-tRNA synthetase
MNEDIDKQLTLIKAKEYDKVDLMKRAAELEARMKYLQVDNENLVRERNNLDIANVNLNKEKSEYEQHIMAIEGELEYFRKSHEDHLDKFDSKFEAISLELSKLKNENIQLKEKEKLNKRTLKDLEEERDEYRSRCKVAEKKSEDTAQR